MPETGGMAIGTALQQYEIRGVPQFMKTLGGHTQPSGVIVKAGEPT